MSTPDSNFSITFGVRDCRAFPTAPSQCTKEQQKKRFGRKSCSSFRASSRVCRHNAGIVP